jgi:hypothetical protein
VGVAACFAVGVYAVWPAGKTRLQPPDVRSLADPPAAVAADALPELGEEEKAYLWEIEHHGNLLSKHGFRPLADALNRADAKALAELLSADFIGQLMARPREVRMRNELVDVVRQEDTGQPPELLDRNQFIARLLSYRQPFTLAPKVQLSLQALAPVTRGVLDGPWQGTCICRIWGETRPGEPREVTLSLRYQLPRPTQENLARKGWLRGCTIAQSQVAHSKRWLLRDVTAERGLDVAPLHDNWRVDPKQAWITSGGVYVCDYNRDGIPDLLITDLNRISLYQGLPGGKFADVTNQVGLPRRPAGPHPSAMIAAFADLDGDGWEDVLLGGVLYRNDQGKRFIPVTSTNLRLPVDAMGVAVADYDGDGQIDLYIIRVGQPNPSSWLSGKTGVPEGNLLLRNKGNWQFENVTLFAGVGGGQRSTFSAVWLDANNDGRPDLYVINEFGDGILYLNRGDGRFREQPLTQQPTDFGSMGVTCGDIDNDGNIDIYTANMYSKAGSRIIGNLRPDTYSEEIMAKIRRFTTGSQLWHNRGGLAFEPLGSSWQVASVGWAFGPALVDLDNDGFLDLYATCGYMSRTRTEPDG